MRRHHMGLAAGLLTSSLLLGPMCSWAATSPKTYTIVIKGLQFTPAQLQVRSGDIVVWSNQDIVPHTVKATKAFNSKNLGAGQSWRFATKRKGHFNYACAYHPTMFGMLIVQ